MAPKAEHLKLLRIVVREDLTVERCTILLRNLNEVMKMLDSSDAKSIEELHKSMHNWNLLESSVKSFRRTNASGVCWILSLENRATLVCVCLIKHKAEQTIVFIVH